MEIVYEAAPLKVLAKHPQRAKLRAKIAQLAADPASLANNVTKLTDRPQSRLRVGDLRVVFVIEGDTLTIEAIGPRGGIYD